MMSINQTPWWNWAAGHTRTVVPSLVSRWNGSGVSPAEQRIEVRVPDDRIGMVNLSALYGPTADASTLAVVIHGHAGNASKPYCHRAAAAARNLGFSSLRVSMRGADLGGEDIYHGGLTSDIAAFTSDRRFDRYQNIVLIGYSLGAQVALRSALDRIDRRIAAVVAISPPIDIPAAVHALDERARLVYRRYMLAGLKKIYRAVADRNRAIAPPAPAFAATSFRRWDELTVVERFGFSCVDHYYKWIDLKHRLEELPVPSLVVASRHDPVIPPSIIRNALRGAPALVTTRWIDGGGHLYFPRQLDLGFGTLAGALEPQCLRWAARFTR